MDLEAKKIQALKEELRRDLEAIERVERLMASKNGSPKDERQVIMPLTLSISDTIGVQDDEENDGQAVSLKGTIESTINSDLSVKWTNQKMLAHLEKTGFPLRAKKPIYSIGQAMQKLSDSGAIKLVRKGMGNQPNIYRGKPKEQPVNTEVPSENEQGGQIGMESRVVQ
jgi:hypothetical protein